MEDDEDNEVVKWWRKTDPLNYQCFLVYRRDVSKIEAGRLRYWDSAPTWPESNRLGVLYYTGKRWIVWAKGALIAAETEYTDVNDPPKFMVESLVVV